MNLDQLAAAVDVHQLPIGPDLQPGPGWTAIIGNRVQRVAEGDVVIGVNGHLAPQRNLVRQVEVREQVGALLVLKHHQRDLAGGSVDALASDFQAPAPSLGPHIGQVGEAPTFPEAFPDILHVALRVRLVLGMADSRRVSDEAAGLGVLQKAPRQDWVEWVGAGHRGGEVVEDDPPGDTVKEPPGGLQPGDYLL